MPTQQNERSRTKTLRNMFKGLKQEKECENKVII